MNHIGTRLSAQAVADLLARIIGPSFYDGPRYGDGISAVSRFGAATRAGAYDRGSAVALNPQPLPPREAHAMALADAHIVEILSLDRAGSLLGGEVLERALGQSLRQVADIDELCPRWPLWPRIWPPPPPPPWELDEVMTNTELLLFGSRFMAAASLASEGKLQDALGRLGEKALAISTENR
jgi:hypothetical protein